MKAGFQIVECSFSSAKRYKNFLTNRCNCLKYSKDPVLVIYNFSKYESHFKY